MRYIPVIFVVVLFIYGLIDCLRSAPADVRSIPKPAWILVIILLPFIGVLLWFFLGRPQYAAMAGSGTSVRVGGSAPGPSYSPRPSRSTAPDDDPAFLRNLEVTRAQKAEAERLRKLKEELDAREARLRDQHPNDETKH
ncbi:PLD nuclease N-terminal domain-containing protein [Specibacter sp. RAF43]|uniref:PLD nuclease N-terminal domain-containing protein n=1 Tax=Specibacter sp. RAF43 TaxID=3233057 RepID=UPI003F978A10